MNSLVQSFRLHLGRKEYDQLDTIWLELIDQNVDTEELFELVELVERYAPAGKAEEFLWILADALKAKKKWEPQFQALKRLVRLSEKESKLASELAANLRQSYGHVPELEKLLQKSGLTYGQPLKQALNTMERYIHLLPGSWLYCTEWGACRVAKLDLLLGRVTVSCAGLTEYTLNLDSALMRLRPLPAGGFFQRLHENKNSLLLLAEENPAELVALYLRDTKEPAGSKELKSALAELVPEQAWEGFWSRARRELESHPHVLVRTRPQRTYQWSDQRIPRQEETRTPPKTPSLKIELPPPEETANLPEQELLEKYKTLSNSAQRRQLLEAVLRTRPELLPRLFVSGKDNKIRAWLLRELENTGQRQTVSNLLEATLTSYREYPDAFLWLADYVTDHAPHLTPAVVTRLLDLLESQTFRRRWPAFEHALAAQEYRLLRIALETLSEPQLRALYLRLTRLQSIENFRQDEIRQLFAARLPDLARPETENVVLSTAAGIARAKQELARLTNEELPRLAEEIGRARAHGDLSENYEYKAAKEKQARLIQRINRLRAELAQARPITTVDCSQVSVGCKVKLIDENGTTVEYALLGPWDSDPEQGIISYLAPLGQKLLGRKLGESLELEGRIHTIKEISALPLV